MQVDFYNEVSLLFGTISEYCTASSCPTMSAGAKCVHHHHYHPPRPPPPRRCTRLPPLYIALIAMHITVTVPLIMALLR